MSWSLVLLSLCEGARDDAVASVKRAEKRQAEKERRENIKEEEESVQEPVKIHSVVPAVPSPVPVRKRSRSPSSEK